MPKLFNIEFTSEWKFEYLIDKWASAKMLQGLEVIKKSDIFIELQFKISTIQEGLIVRLLKTNKSEQNTGNIWRQFSILYFSSFQKTIIIAQVIIISKCCC